MGMKLFDDAADVDELEKIEIDTKFAKRYEHNKKREDLQKLEELKKKGYIESGSESDSESDSDELVAADDLKDFFDGILKIKKKDPILEQKDAKLFKDDDDDDDDLGERKKELKKKPMYIKDVNARNLIEEGADFDDELEDDVENKVKSYVEEQNDVRNEVLAAIAAEEKAVEDEDDDEGFLREKKRNVEEDEEEDEEINEKLDEFFGKDEKLDKNDMFLKDFFKNKLWIDNNKKKNVGNEDEEEDKILSEDEKAIEEQEVYERDYNFRFEESKSDRVLGHSRVVVDSVRKKTNTRKEARERKEKRIEEARVRMNEEVKRLKNLKRKEIQEKISKIKEIAGVDGIDLNEDDLEKDFDPDEFDKKMGSTFGDEYYNGVDVDPEFGDGFDEGDYEKPDFDKEDELLGLPKDWDVVKSRDGFLAKRGKKVFVEEEEEETEGKRKRKRKSKIADALKKDLEEELYKYDYEDTIGDLKTRFKYAKVEPDGYNLSAAEILWLDEEELNQYVSLKKLAPYKEQKWKVRPGLKDQLLAGVLNGKKTQKKRKIDGEGTSKTNGDEGNNEEPTLSRSARRRKSRKERKLPDSRLSAYGKIPSKSKKSKN